MKVLIISLAYPPFIGGAELAVKEITDRIDNINFDLITVNLDGKQPKKEVIGNVNIYRIGKGKLSKYFFPFMAARFAEILHRQNQYDTVWAIMANQAGLAAMKFKNKFPQVKYLLTLQEGDSLKSIWLKTWFIRSWYRSIYVKADYIQAISNFLRNRAIKYGCKGPVEVIPNGVDISNFTSNNVFQELNDFRNQLGLGPNEKVIITVSRLVKKNGVDILIKSMKNLDVRLLILGEGELDSQLKALAQELGLKDKVLFFGQISHKDLPRYLHSADIFVRPSRSEGLGSAFLEAMAAGLPIIATKVGGIPDFLKDRETGLFCEVNNPRDLREKIEDIFEDAELRENLINNGKKLVLQEYDWRAISERMKNIFSKL